MAKGKFHEYTQMEKRLFDLLKGGKKLTISEMVDRVYTDDDAPLYYRETIYATLHRLGAKCRANREPLVLYKEGRNGPRESAYWME